MKKLARMLGVLTLFLVTTGQASTEGCAPPPEAAPDAAPAAAVPAEPAPEATAPAAAPVAAAPASGFPAEGKYGCVQSIPRFRNGSYEYEIETRGFILVGPDGRYTDPYGVMGTYRAGPGSPSVVFAGGALDRATATPLEEVRLWVIIPTESGEMRWSCGPA